MPIYTSAAQFELVSTEETLAQMTDDGGGGNTVNVSIVEYALDRAEAIADSYAGRLYTVPFDPTKVTDAYRDAIYTIAFCKLAKRRLGLLDEDMQRECDAAYAYLEKVADGTVIPFDPDVTPGSPAEAGSDDQIFDDIQVF